MTKVLILNGYSSSNSGDGLLVDETIQLVQDAFGQDVQVTLLASYPESFDYLGIKVMGTKPTLRGYSRDFRRLLRSKFSDFDAVIGVGGGYLRAGSCIELLKMGLVMGPQLIQAARSSTRSVYLPQSIGPARMGTRPIIAKLLKQLDTVWVRDERSLEEFADAGVQRSPDLAILGMKRRHLEFDSSAPLVLTVRRHRGQVPAQVYSLRARLGIIDSFVQSTVGGNDDTAAVKSLMPRNILNSQELMKHASKSRVVIAMRLHAALMAINAGHYVVHLSYERKGFGAFSDLGLQGYVFNVHNFDPKEVSALAHDLATNSARRASYDSAVEGALQNMDAMRSRIVDSIRQAAGVSRD
jgi:polysaccharide pyruvyl transferase WcaK-like protein